MREIAELTREELESVLRDVQAILYGHVEYFRDEGEQIVLDPDRSFDVDDLDRLDAVMRGAGLRPNDAEDGA